MIVKKNYFKAWDAQAQSFTIKTRLSIKKMITEVLLLALALPLFVILFAIQRTILHAIKMISDAENISDEDEIFTDVIDTPKEGVKQHK